jgi:hypothetical protein
MKPLIRWCSKRVGLDVISSMGGNSMPASFDKKTAIKITKQPMENMDEEQLRQSFDAHQLVSEHQNQPVNYAESKLFENAAIYAPALSEGYIASISRFEKELADAAKAQAAGKTYSGPTEYAAISQLGLNPDDFKFIAPQSRLCFHARRKLYDLTHHNVAPIAEEGLKQIAVLYRIEGQIRGRSAEERLAMRQQKSAPKIATFKVWLGHVRTQVSAKSPTGAALKYIAKYWDGLILFLDDGRIEMDSNAVERTIRPIALQRKNALFAGHDAGAQNWAMLASLIETCKLNRIEPHNYLTGILTAILNGHKQKDIDHLLPWNFKS